MGKHIWRGIGLGAMFGIVSVIEFISYFNKSDQLNHEQTRALGAAAAYVQRYEGEHSGLVLDYARQTVELIDTENPLPELDGLEYEIAIIREQIGTERTQANYEPLFASLAKRMEDVADHQGARKSGDIVSGSFLALLGGFLLWGSYKQKI